MAIGGALGEGFGGNAPCPTRAELLKPVKGSGLPAALAPKGLRGTTRETGFATGAENTQQILRMQMQHCETFMEILL
jgi:hypothetical protein